jgi:hypothetical protein
MSFYEEPDEVSSCSIIVFYQKGSLEEKADKALRAIRATFWGLYAMAEDRLQHDLTKS